MSGPLAGGTIRRFMGGVLGVAAAGLAAVSVLGPPAAVAQGTAPPRATGLVIGRVVDGATNAALPGSIVTISGSGIRPKRVIVDPQGRFVFPELPPGGFAITAAKAGYLSGSYGTLRPDGSGRALQLADGERVTDATVRLWRFATISGTVTDDAGDPVNFARVQAFKRTIVAGRWSLTSSGLGANADERGAYRITGLTPGDYALVITSVTSTLPMSLLQAADFLRVAASSDGAAIARELTTNGTFGYANDLMQGFPASRVGDLLLQASGNAMVGADGRSVETYPTVWYPGTATPADAALVTVGAGDNRNGIDLHPMLTKAVRISGMALGPDGPVGHLALRLVPARLEAASAEITSSLALSLTTAIAATDMNGAFTFLAVPPGQYIIRAITSPRPPPEAQPASGAALPPLVAVDPTWWAATRVSVGETDTAGVTVTLRRGLRVTGRVEFAGAAARPGAAELRAIRASMDPADGRTFAYPSSYQAQVDPNGRFYTIGLVAGRYLLRVDAAPRGWTVKSAMVGGRDICDVPLSLEDADVDGLVLTFTDRPSSMAGTVRNAEGRPDGDATVLIFPTESTWTDLGTMPRRLRGARASRTGTFSATGLPAGEYFVIAVSEAAASNWQDPAFLQKLARLATRVSLGDGQALSLNLTAVGGIAR